MKQLAAQMIENRPNLLPGLKPNNDIILAIKNTSRQYQTVMASRTASTGDIPPRLNTDSREYLEPNVNISNSILNNIIK